MSANCPKCGGYLFPGLPGFAHKCPDAPTELTSLREIKDKLDRLLNYKEPPFDERHRVLCDKLDALAESQGKMLAALNETHNDTQFLIGYTKAMNETLFALDAGLHETAMRNHAQVLAWLRRPRKASKKARRAVGKAR